MIWVAPTLCNDERGYSIYPKDKQPSKLKKKRVFLECNISEFKKEISLINENLRYKSISPSERQSAILNLIF